MGMNVLIVDDSKATRREMIRTLRKENSLEAVLEAGNGIEALKLITDKKVDLILTDLIMPVMDGFHLIETLNRDARFSGIPVVLLTVRSDLASRVKGLERGAWDFLVKPIHPVELTARVKAMLRVKKLQDQLKTQIHQLERLSIIDGLTGLYNKKYMIEFLRREANRAKRFRFMLSCVMMDVDHFKEINDTFGHTRGDRVLKELGGLLGDRLRGYDFAARYGGDEFTLVLPQQTQTDGAKGLADRIRKSVEEHVFEKNGARRPIRITVSMGIATLFPDSPDDHETLLERADNALYEAKAQGRNRVVMA